MPWNILTSIRYRTQLCSMEVSDCLFKLNNFILENNGREHCLLKDLLTVLKEGGLTLKLQRGLFIQSTVEYLGHIVNPG